MTPLPLPAPRSVSYSEVDSLKITIILTVHGWTRLEVDALARLRQVCSMSSSLGYLLVQNRLLSFGDTLSADPAALLVHDPSFGAACAAGARRVLAGSDWLIFTQADVDYGYHEVIETIRLGATHNAAAGVSGGEVRSWPPVIEEFGRNAGRTGPRRAVDFLAGYWVAVSRDHYLQADGWSEDYALYWEDVDFGMRLRVAGVACVIDKWIEVNHARNSTINREHGCSSRSLLQRQSQSRFEATWAKTIRSLG